MKIHAGVSAQYLKLNAVLDTFMTIRIRAGKKRIFDTFENTYKLQNIFSTVVWKQLVLLKKL